MILIKLKHSLWFLMACFSLISAIAMLVSVSQLVTVILFPLKADTGRRFKGILANGTINPVANTTSYITSAYFDSREKPKIFVIGISKRHATETHYCHFYCDSHLPSVKARINVLIGHFDFPYAATKFQCDLPLNCIPKYVSISGPGQNLSLKDLPFLKIQNLQMWKWNEPTNFEHNFTVCLPTLFAGYNKVLQFVQSIEMYRILGAQHIVLYKTNCSKDMETVLEYYEKIGFIEVIPWPVTSYLNPSKGWQMSSHPGDIHYFGQVVIMNDCLYRNMYKSKFIFLHDIDEIILPLKHSNWAEMIEFLVREMPDTDIFLIRSLLMPVTVYDENNTFPAEIWKGVLGENFHGPDILQHIYHEPYKEPINTYTKVIVNPRKVKQTSVHVVTDSYGKEGTAAFKICRLYHFREPEEDIIVKNLKKDTSLWRYSSLLRSRVHKVLNATLCNRF
ncbi:uncharacterized protein LOC122794665 isoform X1 [Protopterus annectens]|uniref:uncharacterized protein LOC122794665 isoform X1 n=1 Tax=Protopterus annectens TaxID=7888 RepID=UPI001CFC146E|nr:uncharacterized protein LOC122794665 isoform X1 [Protopterus annectens]